VGESFLHDCEPAVMDVYRGWQQELRRSGAKLEVFEPDWEDTPEISLGIQAHEASELHRGNFDHLEPTIAARLAWGASLSAATVENFRKRRAAFSQRIDLLLEQHDFLILPCAPMSALPAGIDHSATRPKIMRYTTPASLAGTPTVTLSASGGGVQLIAARGADAKLLAFAAGLGEKIALRS
jgi:Asp-tRNA(Asn)/Glu-tRNA(Gln) amidotransferase A subunit family amidase